MSELLYIRARTTFPKLFYPIPIFLGALYVGLIFLGAFLSGAYREASVALWALALLLIPELTFRRFNIRAPLLLLYAMALLILASLILGELAQFYDRFWWWDIPIHTLGGSIMAYAAYLVLTAKFLSIRTLSFWAQMFLIAACVLFSVGVSGAWEIYEYNIDSLFATRMQPSAEDTMHDLIAALLGALVGSIAILRSQDFIFRSSDASYDGTDRQEC